MGDTVVVPAPQGRQTIIRPGREDEKALSGVEEVVPSEKKREEAFEIVRVACRASCKTVKFYHDFVGQKRVSDRLTAKPLKMPTVTRKTHERPQTYLPLWHHTTEW